MFKNDSVSIVLCNVACDWNVQHVKRWLLMYSRRDCSIRFVVLSFFSSLMQLYEQLYQASSIICDASMHVFKQADH